jgi:osmotically-inducible protein OsmY
MRGEPTLAFRPDPAMTMDPLRRDASITDLDIANAVMNALMAELGVPHGTITARVHDRWVWLLGKAYREDQRAAAQRAAETVIGIKGVTSMVVIARRST